MSLKTKKTNEIMVTSWLAEVKRSLELGGFIQLLPIILLHLDISLNKRKLWPGGGFKQNLRSYWYISISIKIHPLEIMNIVPDLMAIHVAVVQISL